MANCERRNADRSAEQIHRRLYLIFYRKLLKRLVVAGTAGFLCLPSLGATFRYASSSNRIYVEGGGTATLTAIKTALPNAPLYLVDPSNQIWLLRASLFIADGCTVQIHGSPAGGDANELRLLSNNSGAPNSVVMVDADWGTISLNATKVTSWNEASNGADTEYLVHQRASVRARSRKTGSIVTQSSLNVVNSEVAHLGFNHREGYGLTWQVVSSVAGVKVFGTVSGSSIHDCQLGVGTWAVDDVSWTGNEIAYNELYGFDAADPGHQAVLASNNVHDNEYGATFKWSGTSQRIYITGPGTATLTDIKAALPTAPLTLVNASNLIWHAGANLFVEKGARLKLYGPSLGGDVGELRLKSDNTAASNAFVELRADWGWLDIRSTRITSWDSAANGPDLETDTYRRAYVRARSSLDPDGVTPRESRMDVIDSDIGYLGSHHAEAYGLVWKVVDTTQTLPPGVSLFDLVNVYGDILNSRLHHNYFGNYSYGHFGGQWRNNEIDHNIGYGLDPHDDSDFLVIENNNAHHNGWHGIIASKRCDHGIMRNNIAWANGKNGLMLHRSCDDWLVENNQSFGNADSGLAIFATSRTLIRNNLLSSNDNAGIRFSVGSADNVVTNNDIGHSGQYGLYFYEGSDPPEPGDNGRPKRNLFVNNSIHHSGGEGIKLGDGDDNQFIGNTFFANGSVLRFERGLGNLLKSNSIPANVTVKSAGTSAEPASTFIERQPLLKVQVDAYSSFSFLDDDGAIFDPEENNLATLAGPAGSMLTLGAAEIGTTSLVATRRLLVSAPSASAFVDPTVWNTGGDFSKQWTTLAGSSGALFTYTAGDLAPNTQYRILKGGTLVQQIVSDSSGWISFTDSTGSAGTVTYSIVP